MSEKKFHMFFISVFFLIILSDVYHFYNIPILSRDATVTLSCQVSILNGNLLENSFTQFRQPLLYYYILTPWFWFCGFSFFSVFGLIIFSKSIWTMIAYRLSGKNKLSALIILCCLCSPQFSDARPELPLSIISFLIIHYILFSNNYIKIFVICSFLILLHPAMGLISILSVFLLKNNFSKIKFMLISFLAIIFSAMVLFLFSIFFKQKLELFSTAEVFFQRFNQNLFASVISHFRENFFIWVSFIAFLIFVSKLHKIFFVESVKIIVIIAFASLFGKDYYYVYLFPFIILTLSKFVSEIKTYYILFPVISFICFCHTALLPVWLNPNFKHFINRYYAIESYIISKAENKVFLPAEFAFPVLKFENVRWLKTYENIEEMNLCEEIKNADYIIFSEPWQEEYFFKKLKSYEVYNHDFENNFIFKEYSVFQNKIIEKKYYTFVVKSIENSNKNYNGFLPVDNRFIKNFLN